MPELFRLCSPQEIAPGTARRFDSPDGPVALVRVGDDLYAIGDTCSHEDYSLSEGEVYPELCEIECWKHGSAFDLVTGAPKTLPATKPVPVYPVHIEGDDVTIEIGQER